MDYSQHLERTLVVACVAFILGIIAASKYQMPLVVLALGFVLVGIYGILRKQKIAFIAAMFLAGWMMIGWLMLPTEQMEYHINEKVDLIGEVKESASGSYSLTLRANMLNGTAMPIEANVAVVKAYKDENNYHPGEIVHFYGVLQEPWQQCNPGGFSQKDYWQSKGVFYLLDADQPGDILAAGSWWQEKLAFLQQSIKTTLAENLEQRDYGIALAMLMGDKSEMDDAFYSMTQKMGIAHVFAVSGLHVGFVLGMLMLFFKLIKRENSMLAIVCIGLVLIGYCALTGFAASAQRATIMAILALLARKWLRFRDIYSIMAAAALVILINDPFALWSVGFQLSFAVCWGIVFFYPLWYRWLKRVPSKWLRNTLAVIFAAQTISMPLIAWHFKMISFFAAIFNFLIVPIIGIIVPLLWIGLLAAMLPVGSGVVFSCVTILIKAIVGFLNFFNRVIGSGQYYIGQPKWWILVLFVLCMIAWRYRWLQKWGKKICIGGAIATIGLLYFLPNPVKPTDMLIYLDVGQGSGAVARTKQGQCIVFDTGKSSDTVAAYLRYCGINVIDAVILSHGDSDHTGGLETLLGDFRVKQVMATETAWQNENLQRLQQEGCFGNTEKYVAEKSEYKEIGSVRLYLEPIAEAYSKNGDLFAALQYQDSITAAFPGDMTTEALEDMLNKGVSADIWAVPHHGSKNNMYYGMYERLKPEAAIISAGRNNSYGHPHQIVLDELTNSGVAYFRTDESGAIEITWDDKKLFIQPYLEKNKTEILWN